MTTQKTLFPQPAGQKTLPLLQFLDCPSSERGTSEAEGDDCSLSTVLTGREFMCCIVESPVKRFRFDNTVLPQPAGQKTLPLFKEGVPFRGREFMCCIILDRRQKNYFVIEKTCSS